jgi:hypothetical protein
MRTLILFVLSFAASAFAGENEIFLKDGPGKPEVISQCSVCHSLDYITMNARIQDHAGWEKTVNKMIDVMGAPIADADKQTIIDYLVQNYGK